jgi:hypothetical protein
MPTEVMYSLRVQQHESPCVQGGGLGGLGGLGGSPGLRLGGLGGLGGSPGLRLGLGGFTTSVLPSA